MPAHFTHIYLAKQVAHHLLSDAQPNWTSGAATPYTAEYCGQIMTKWEKFTATGAIGPDLFYFSQDYAGKIAVAGVVGPVPPSDEIMLALAIYYSMRTAAAEDWEPLLIILDEVSSVLGALVRLLIKLEKIWRDFIGMWASTIGPFVNAADAALDDLTGGLISQFQVGVQELKAALKLVVEQELLSVVDIFGSMDTCVEKGWSETSFIWGDMLHYRRTTLIAKNLIRQAEALRATDQAKCEQMLALAFGWLTHVGGDTIGHSFVNTQCGGPFRNHPTRHHLIENHIDAWNYHQARAGGTLRPDPIAQNDQYPNLTSSGLAFAVQIPFGPGHSVHTKSEHRPGTPPADQQSRKGALSTDGELPLWAANAIVEALIDTYDVDNPKEPARPTHPTVYQGSKFQSTIDENLLGLVAAKVFGSKPAGMLRDEIAPDPPRYVPVGYPLPWQVQVCYRLMLTFYGLGYTGSWELDKPRKPNVVILPPSSDVTNLLSPPDFSGASSGNPVADLCDALKAFVDWAEKELDAALKLAGDLIKMLTSPGTYPIRLALYELAMLVWDVVCKTHEMLAHVGFVVPHGEARYDDGEARYEDRELRLANEIDVPLITLGGTVDATFRKALDDALDPMGNYDRNTGLIVGHPVPDSRYPLYHVVRYNDQEQPDRDGDGTVKKVEYRRPWAYPAKSPTTTGYRDTPTEKLQVSAVIMTDVGTASLMANPSVVGQRDVRDPNLGSGVHPGTSNQKPSGAFTISGPFPEGVTPDQVFFSTADVGDPSQRAQYEEAVAPQDTENLNWRYLQSPAQDVSPLGGLVPFSAYLIDRVANDPDYAVGFNLDSDRAYGYLTWDWHRYNDPGDQNHTDHEDLGFPFREPVTWPQFAKGWTGPDAELQLDYIDLAHRRAARTHVNPRPDPPAPGTSHGQP